jgi:hypothetical protein
MDKQIATTQTTDLIIRPEVPEEVLKHPGRYPVAPYLPKSLISTLPEIVKAEISQSMLKSSSDQEINVFTAKILNFFNPKFESETEVELVRVEIYTFAMRCELTPDEFLLALHLATEGKLKTEIDKDGNAETIKLYREIDIIKLGEVKAAYMRYKSTDPKYTKGIADVKAFLSPPSVELTPEQKQNIWLKFLKDEFARLQDKGEVLGSVQYYDILRKKHDLVKIGFVEKFMMTFVPEEHTKDERSKAIHLASSKKIIKKDLFLSFKELFVSSYITKMKLKDGTEKDWISHWESLKKGGNE